MRYDYIVGYLTWEYVRYFCYWYVVIFIINLGQIFGSEIRFSFPALFFTREPIVHMGAYFSIILTWNYTKKEDQSRHFGKTNTIYFKSIGFLYFTMITINLISALWGKTGISLGLFVVRGYAFYVVCLIYTIIELYKQWDWGEDKNHGREMPDLFK